MKNGMKNRWKMDEMMGWKIDEKLDEKWMKNGMKIRWK